MLVKAGHRVTGTTRSPQRAEDLRRAGIKPVVVDVFDALALRSAVEDARPEIVIHQLTDLANYLDQSTRAEALERNARLRIQGTANLVAAALMAGARRLIAQSISFAYAPGKEPYRETDPLYLDARGTRGISVGGVAALEREVMQTPGIDGIVLRYGWLYGPGTGADKSFERGAVHVDAAAHAAVLAIDRGKPGIYNVAEDDGAVTTDKARTQLGFDPTFRAATS